MRYIGNKTRLLEQIELFILENKITGKVLCDLFAGTGAVSDYFKDRYLIIANDFLYYSSVLTRGKIQNSSIPEFHQFKNEYGKNPFA